MTDFRLVAINLNDLYGTNLRFDWATLASGVVDESMELASAVLIALNTDATADDSDVLPDPRSTDRRGWWGDENAKSIWDGWPIGSRLWLLKRAKIIGYGSKEGATVNRVRGYLTECLQLFVDNGICSNFSIDSIIVDAGAKRISTTFTMFRGPKSAIKLSYQPLWDRLFSGE
jgi:phage gp46-like protein